MIGQISFSGSRCYHRFVLTQRDAIIFSISLYPVCSPLTGHALYFSRSGVCQCSPSWTCSLMRSVLDCTYNATFSFHLHPGSYILRLFLVPTQNCTSPCMFLVNISFLLGHLIFYHKGLLAKIYLFQFNQPACILRQVMSESKFSPPEYWRKQCICFKTYRVHNTACMETWIVRLYTLIQSIQLKSSNSAVVCKQYESIICELAKDNKITVQRTCMSENCILQWIIVNISVIS